MAKPPIRRDPFFDIVQEARTLEEMVEHSWDVNSIETVRGKSLDDRIHYFNLTYACCKECVAKFEKAMTSFLKDYVGKENEKSSHKAHEDIKKGKDWGHGVDR